MLSVILSYSALLLKDSKHEDPVREDVAVIHGAGERAAMPQRPDSVLVFAPLRAVVPFAASKQRKRLRTEESCAAPGVFGERLAESCKDRMLQACCLYNFGELPATVL